MPQSLLRFHVNVGRSPEGGAGAKLDLVPSSTDPFRSREEMRRHLSQILCGLAKEGVTTVEVTWPGCGLTALLAAGHTRVAAHAVRLLR